MANEANPLTVQMQNTFTWNTQFTDALLGQQGSSSGLQFAQKFINQVGASPAVNQAMVIKQVVGAGATVTVDLSAAVTNLAGTSGATITHVLGCLICLPSTAQNASLGSTASSITVGAAGSNTARFMRLNATGTFDLENGGSKSSIDGSTGWVIDSTHKSLQIVNNDGSNAANVYICLVGNDS